MSDFVYVSASGLVEHGICDRRVCQLYYGLVRQLVNDHRLCLDALAFGAGQ